MSYLVVFSHCLIAVVFLASAVGKTRDGRRFQEFAGSLAAMRVLPNRLALPAAVAVAATELAVPVLLLPLPLRVLAVTGLATAAVLLTGFAVAIVLVLRRGVRASCRCFGGTDVAPFGWHHVVRNAALAVLAGAGIYAELNQYTVSLDVLALAAPCGLIGAMLIIRLDDLVDLLSPVSARR